MDPKLNFNLNFQSFSQIWSSKQILIIVGDFIIHVDVEKNSLGEAFISLFDWFDSFGFNSYF